MWDFLLLFKKKKKKAVCLVTTTREVFLKRKENQDFVSFPLGEQESDLD
jgi:hypothetical protein